VAPALATGCTIVLKPAPSTRLTAWAFCQIVLEAGIPAGVVNVVSGDNDMAQHLSTHPGLDKIAFTGSTPVPPPIRK
ncbi:Aldehyde/histidinol dehydrogenase, partial [Baffinella frigidus]